MSDDGSPPPKPPITKATAAQLAEGRAKRAAYEEQRHRYTQAWHRRLASLADEPDAEPEQVHGPQPGQPPVTCPRQNPGQAPGPELARESAYGCNAPPLLTRSDLHCPAMTPAPAFTATRLLASPPEASPHTPAAIRSRASSFPS